MLCFRSAWHMGLNMAKNHYVSQFVIKRFSDAINIFDIHSGKIDESKRPHKVFYHNDIYEDETEKLFAHIESRVANIIDQKILKHDTITLTRKELLLLKRYMLICSVRTQTPDGFAKIIRGFESNAMHYISIYNNLYNQKITLPNIKDLRLTDDELYARALKVFATTESIRDIANNYDATSEMLAWAVPFLESYLAFWDTPNEKEYILTDCGMTSEYEGFHLITGGIDISKTSYLLNKIKDEPGYAGILASQFVMYENYNIFVLSSTRSMVMINPFFRLYHGQGVTYLSNNNPTSEITTLECPDIWPAVIQNRSLFGIPSNEYCFSPTMQCNEDRFIYTPKTLTQEDTVYINTLLLSQAKDIIGFNDARKIIDSVYYFVWHQGNYRSVERLTDSPEEVLLRLIEKVATSPFLDLCKYCDTHGGANKTEFLFLFEKLTANIYKDFNSNPYICEYYLERPTETINCHVLDFLGEGEKRLEVFKKILDKINKGRGTTDV